jgi:hypothetical protein
MHNRPACIFVCDFTSSCDQAGYLGVKEQQWSTNGNFDSEEERVAVQRLGFLFLMYRPSMWWFEIAEMFRKLLMVCD